MRGSGYKSAYKKKHMQRSSTSAPAFTSGMQRIDKNSVVFSVAALAFLLLVSFSHSRVLINNPSLGQELEILAENEQAPAEAVLISPDGQRISVPFENGQLRYRMQQAGTWGIEVGARKYTLSVSAPSSANSDSAPAAQSDSMLPLSLAIAVILGICLSAVALYFLFMRPIKSIPPMLEKKREGPAVRIRLCAGTIPLNDIMLEDDVGKGFKDGPKRMARAKLAAGQVMELSYAWAGPLGEVRVRFLMDELPFEMKCTEGVVMLKESEEQNSDAPAAPFSPSRPSSPPALRSRKLGRKKD